ncbi:MAG: hypothetical protein HOQ03_09390, partial [Thermoleophilia bacterium]|nr:hypothetical protein [Thermoleophilia bacterium]
MSKRFPIIEPEGRSSVQLSLAERYGILHNVFVHQWFALQKRIGEEFGWDVANRLSVEVADEATPLLAEGYRRKFGLEGEGAALVSQVMQTEFLGEGSEVDLHHEDRDSAEVDINCTFGAMLQKPKFGRLPVTDGLCEGGCRGWAGDIARSVDPELRADRLTWMGDGAPVCKFKIWRQPAAADEP